MSSAPHRPGAAVERAGIVLGPSPAFRQVLRELEAAAQVDSTVVLEGETGAGKGMMARVIHMESARAGNPFITVCCAEMPDSLVQSELFGHERGAFTGADRRKPGRFERAHGGTLFLDELGDLTPGIQLALLRVLETGHFERIGGTESVEADFRLICATHQDLGNLVREGTFRLDLYYRLQVLRIEMPPLRERRDDILPLARAFLRRSSVSLERRFSGFSPEVERKLLAWSWPGNVRELSNVVERAAAFSSGPLIEVWDLPRLFDPRTGPVEQPEQPAETWVEIQKSILRKALLQNGGNRHATARELGLDRGTLYSMLRRWELEEVGRLESGG